MPSSRMHVGLAITAFLSLVVIISMAPRAEQPAGKVVSRGEPIEYKSRDAIADRYKWNLHHIYADREAWLADGRELAKQVAAFARHQGKLADSPKALTGALADYAAILRLRDKLYVYAKLGLDVNTADPEQQALYAQAEKLNTMVREHTAWVAPEIFSIPPERMEQLLQAPETSPYQRFLQQLLRGKQHSLAKDEEQLLAKTTPLAELPEQVYASFFMEISFPDVAGKDQVTQPLTNTNFSVYLQSPDRELRKSAFTAYYQTLARYQRTFARLLAGEVEANNLYASVYHYQNALEASLASNEIPSAVYEQLIAAVNQHLPLLHRYMERKKQILGVDELHMYDLYAPLLAADEAYIPFEQAMELVLEATAPLGDDYVSALRNGFQSGWIDVFPVVGKRSGAYHWGSYDSHPYVLLNYMGTSRDVSTLAHELGHAMQSYYTRQNQPYLYADYPIFTAEVASTLNEILLFEHRYKRTASKKEKILLLDQFLENVRTTLFRQTQFAEFEKELHETAQQGKPLTADTISRMYYELNKKYYGPHVVSDPEIALEWARVPHFYRGFYVYQYATSFAASLALAEQINKEGESAAKRIREQLLSKGSSVPPMQVLRDTGVDMSTAAPIHQAMEVFAEKLDELERLLAEQ